MKEVGNICIFKRTVRPTFKAGGGLSTKNLHRFWTDDLPAKGPSFDVRTRPHHSAGGRLEIFYRNLRQGEEGTEKVDPSYLIPIFPREQPLENLLSPRRVLLRYTGMPTIQEIEFDGDNVPFAPG